jgi:predicted amidohydrolase YtcJ
MKKLFEDLTSFKFVVEDGIFSSALTADRKEKVEGYIYPGFIDSHAHLVGLGLKKITPSLEDLPSVDEIMKVAKSSDAMILRGWDDEIIGRYPEKSEIDLIDRPLLLVRRCGHIGIANEKFLRIAKIDSDDGILRESKMINALKSLKPDHEFLKKAVDAGQKEFFRYGVTSVHSDDSSDLPHETVKELFSDLKIDVYEHLHIHSLEEMERLLTLKPKTIKLLVDGSLGARTAFLRSKYDDFDGRGLLNFNRDELVRIIQIANENGIQVAAHAIGDGALDVLLDAFAHSDPSLRHRIIHVQMAWPEQIKKIGELKICVDLQPQFFVSDEKMSKERIGSRMKVAYPFKAIIDNGIRAAFSSDAPVEIPDPLLGIKAAIKMGIDVQTALKAYTVEGAFQEFKEGNKGLIKDGMIADFVVLSRPLGEDGNRVLATYKRGEKVWSYRTIQEG